MFFSLYKNMFKIKVKALSFSYYKIQYNLSVCHSLVSLPKDALVTYSPREEKDCVTADAT